MKLNINIPKHRNDIAKHLAGEMLPEEDKAFVTMVNSHPDNYALLDNMKKDWKLLDQYQAKSPNVDKAWQTLQAKLQNEEPFRNSLKTPFYQQGWTQWVAAVVVIVIVSSIFLTRAIWGDTTIQTFSDPNTLVHTLADGSTVYLEANSTLTYSNRFGRNEREVTLKGEAFFDVVPDATRPFVVETKDARVQVLGTSFLVKSVSNSNFEVIVQTGTVNVSTRNDRDPKLIANAGDRIALIKNQLTKTTGQVAPSLKFKQQRFQFKDESLGNIIQVINKTYGVNIVLGSPDIGDRMLTVTFMNNSVPSMVEVICAALQLDAKFENNAITLWHHNNDN